MKSDSKSHQSCHMAEAVHILMHFYAGIKLLDSGTSIPCKKY